MINRKVFDTQTFIKKSKNLYDNFYDYSKSEYKNSHTKLIITCPKHGDFLQTPSNHLHKKKYGCRLCGVEKNTKNNLIREDIYIKRFTDKWGKKFDYSKVKYLGYKNNIIIVCPNHGDFEIRPDVHLRSKYGCPKCSEEAHPGKYTQKYFVKNPEKKDIPGIFYRFDKLKYFKIGITINEFKIRHPKEKSILEHKTTIYNAFLIEEECKKVLEFRIKDPGHTECFGHSNLNEKIFRDICKKYNITR